MCRQIWLKNLELHTLFLHILISRFFSTWDFMRKTLVRILGKDEKNFPTNAFHHTVVN